ncbi:hypothetical protein SAMN06314042_1133 [Epsilonproteobacteria bacterium SCGC AD-308-O04]|jgi:hypothetical protein|nr:hypothetical protein SAMN06314042_1133 [Epsilonproteobacteria bacterium SCGC AD-308-O04]
MQNDYIDLVEPTPKLHSKKCRIISFLLRIFLQFSIYLITVIVWVISDFFIALLSLVLSFIIIGIVRSKIRNSVIPTKQREYQYNDQGIADWYTAKEICNDELEQKLESL